MSRISFVCILLMVSLVSVSLCQAQVTVDGPMTGNVAENASREVSIGTYTAKEDDEVVTVAWTISGMDINAFRIDAAGNLFFTLISDLDYETKQSYSVNVVANDGSGTDINPLAVTVNITNVNEHDGVVALTVGGAEPASVKVGDEITASLTDGDFVVPISNPTGTIPDANVQWQWSRGNTPISGQTAAAYRAVAADKGNTLTVTATYSDGTAGPKTARKSTGTVLRASEGNEPPVITVGTPSTVDYPENGTGPVATYTATDDDEGDTLTWSLSMGEDDFEISGATVSFKEETILDYETLDPPTFTYTVAVSDGLVATPVTLPVTVSITNVNEHEGVVALVPSSVKVLDRITATLKDGDAVTPDDTDEDTEGTITDGVIWQWTRGTTVVGTNANTYDAVAADEGYTLTVTATYPDGTSGTKTATASTGTVLRASTDNEAPVITVGTPSAVDYPENGTGPVATYTATDEDEGDTLTWSLSADEGDNFEISGATVSFKADTPLDYETLTTNPYEYTVAVSDGIEDAALEVTVNIINVNEHAGVVALAVGVEDLTSVKVGDSIIASLKDGDFVTAINEDGNIATTAVIWQWTRGNTPVGADATYPVVAADVGNTLTVTATYSDGTTGSKTATASTSTVLRASGDNAAPVITEGTPPAVDYPENGTGPVATYTATDDDEGDTLTWSLSMGEDDFEISGATVSFKAETILDYEKLEAPYTYTYTVTVSDGIVADELDVTVSIINVNEHEGVVTLVPSSGLRAPGTITATLTDGDAVTPSDASMALSPPLALA